METRDLLRKTSKEEQELIKKLIDNARKKK